MSFRADEKVKEGLDEAMRYFVGRHIPVGRRERSKRMLLDLIDRHGPVVQTYPRWHPLVASSKKTFLGDPITLPCEAAGYEGLDHTIYLRNAFLTCPYGGVQRIVKSVERLKPCPIATITAEALDEHFYVPDATPVLVTCEWDRLMERDGTIPKSIAVPLLLEMEIPAWLSSHSDRCAETWETMRPYILGSPRGSRSSLFVNQETGQTLKAIWNALIYTGMFGPIHVGR